MRSVAAARRSDYTFLLYLRRVDFVGLIPRSEFLGQAFVESKHRSLRCGIRGIRYPSCVSRNTCRGNNMPMVRLDHVGKELPDHLDLSQDVDLECTMDLFLGFTEDQLHRHHASVVDEHRWLSDVLSNLGSDLRMSCADVMSICKMLRWLGGRTSVD